MTDIEILDEMEPEEFGRAVKKECVFHVDENCVETWVIRLVYEDGTVKYVQNLAVPVDNDGTERVVLAARKVAGEGEYSEYPEFDLENVSVHLDGPAWLELVAAVAALP